MSHIPNSAMPHAAPSQEAKPEQEGGTFASGLSDTAGKVAEYARENPKTAIAAGAALAAGVVAAAIPLVRGRGKGSEGSGSGGAKTGSRSKAASKSGGAASKGGSRSKSGS